MLNDTLFVLIGFYTLLSAAKDVEFLLRRRSDRLRRSRPAVEGRGRRPLSSAAQG